MVRTPNSAGPRKFVEEHERETTETVESSIPIKVTTVWYVGLGIEEVKTKPSAFVGSDDRVEKITAIR